MVSAKSVIQHIVETFQLIVIDSYEEKRMINYLNSAKIPYEEVTENDL